ncbi:MAG: hypothetical protein GX140_08970 [Bacteroidales bacterium]|jgi:hypothetical protein|nr:hypothetical protein [Bacteroidales bacterium]
MIIKSDGSQAVCSQIYESNVNNYVGIGTTSPLGKLSVENNDAESEVPAVYAKQVLSDNQGVAAMFIGGFTGVMSRSENAGGDENHGIMGVSTGSSESDKYNSGVTGNASSEGNGDSYGVLGRNVESKGAGVYGESNNADAMGVLGKNENKDGGTGVAGFGNNVAETLLSAGSGGAFAGKHTGVYAKVVESSGEAIYTESGSNVVRVNHFNSDSTAQYKIIGHGAVSTIVEDINGDEVVMHAPETPEYYFMDYGEAQLVEGRVHVELDPNFTKNVVVNKDHPMRVFVQLEDDCNGVFVTNKTATGFDVIELSKGKSNAKFQWNVVCNVADQTHEDGRVSRFSSLRFEKAPKRLDTKTREKRNTKISIPRN